MTMAIRDPQPGEVVVNPFPVSAGELQVGGLPLSRLAARVGCTPFYAYDRAVLVSHVRGLRAALPAGVDLHYAVKANPMPALIHAMAGLVDGMDVASAGEMARVLDAGVDPAGVSFAGPGKTVAELRQAVAAGIAVSLESESEIPALAQAGLALGVRPRVLVRVNPDFDLKSSGMKMSGGPRPFGIDAERVPAALVRVARAGLLFEGFHVYAGSQGLDAAALGEMQERTVDLMLRLAADAPASPAVFNIGGGYGVPYFPGDRHLALESVMEPLARQAARARHALPGVRLVLELGRYLVAHCGVYVVRVIDRKVSRGRTFLVTDGGLHHHLAATGNLGQVLRRNFPLVAGLAREGQTESASVTGPLCTPLDVLGEKVELPPVQAGDLLCVLLSGAYGATASPQGFLGHPPVVEVLV